MSYRWRNSETENRQSYYLRFPIKLSRLERKILQELDEDPLSAKRFLTARNGRDPTRIAAVCKSLQRQGLMDRFGSRFAPAHCEEAYALTRLGWCALHKGGALRSYALAIRDLLRTLDDGTTLVPDTARYWQKHWLYESVQEGAEPQCANNRAYVCEWLAEQGLVSSKSTVDWEVIRGVECGYRRGRRRKDYPGQITYTRSERGERLLAWLENRYAGAPDLTQWYFSSNEGARTPGLPRHRESFGAPEIRPWPRLSSL